MPGLHFQRVTAALKAATDNGKPALVADFARTWSIEGRPARRAAIGKEVDATTYLKLCAALGMDPVTEKLCERRVIPEIDWQRVGVKITLAFIGTPQDPAPKGFTMRVAAKLWGIPIAPLCRMKAGHKCSTDNLLKLCSALDCHPHTFLKLVPAHVSQLPEAEQAVPV